MTRLFCIVLCAAAVRAGDPPQEGIVGLEARVQIEMQFQGRPMSRPATVRQVAVAIGEGGLFLTAPLPADTQYLRLFEPGSTEGLEAEIVETDESFALVRCEEADRSVVPFARDWAPKAGDRIHWVGVLPGAVGKWRVVTKEATVDLLLFDDPAGADAIYSDPPFHGPVAARGALVLDAAGRAVGIVGSRQAAESEGGTGARGQGGTLPIVRLVAAFAPYLEGAAGNRGALGIAVEALSERLAEALGLKGAAGVVVTEVTPGSGAEKGGIRPQDILASVGGAPTGTPALLRAALRGKGAGEQVKVEGFRVGASGTEPFACEVTLGAPEESAAKERLRAARFGFVAEPIPPAVRRAQNLPADLAGLHVRRVTPGGPAALGRPTPLRRGDVLLKVGDAEVRDLPSLEAALAAAPDGTPIALFVRRGQETRFVEVTPEPPAD